METAGLIQLVRELDSLKKEVKDLKEELQPVFEREARLQKEAEYDKLYPHGWWYRDKEHPEEGIILG